MSPSSSGIALDLVLFRFLRAVCWPTVTMESSSTVSIICFWRSETGTKGISICCSSKVESTGTSWILTGSGAREGTCHNFRADDTEEIYKLTEITEGVTTIVLCTRDLTCWNVLLLVFWFCNGWDIVNVSLKFERNQCTFDGRLPNNELLRVTYSRCTSFWGFGGPNKLEEVAKFRFNDAKGMRWVMRSHAEQYKYR